MRALNVLLSVLVSLVLGVCVFELGLRLVPAFRPQKTINQFDPRLGWSKKPSDVVRRRTPELDITFRTNAEGLRDDPGAMKKPAGTFRVMALGDSFVLGYTVDREDLFVDQMETYWKAQGRKVDVINSGTEGWSTDQEVLWFLEDGVKYQPDLVLIFPYDNDIYWCGQDHYQRYPKPRFVPDDESGWKGGAVTVDVGGSPEQRKLEDPGPQPWWKDTAIGKFLSLFHHSPEDYFRVDGAKRPIFKEFAPLLNEQPDFLADALSRTKSALRGLQTECDNLKVPLVMAPIPSEMAIQPDERAKFQDHTFAGIDPSRWSPDRPFELFLGMAKDLGIRTVDVRPALREHVKEGERLYFDKEWHFTPLGNERFAQALVAQLGDTWFPPDHAAVAEGHFDAPAEGQGKGLPRWPFVFGALWLVLGWAYGRTYPDESAGLAFLKVGALLATIFAIVLGGGALVALVPPAIAPIILLLFLVGVLGFVAFKLGRRLGTIVELLKAFTLRGHWYLMPLVVVLLTIGSLLVVAATSPLIAPFIYTLF